jgi:twitching motility protein PilT
MQLLDDAIMDLYKKRWISADEAYAKANDKEKFRDLVKPEKLLDFTEV